MWRIVAAWHQHHLVRRLRQPFTIVEEEWVGKEAFESSIRAFDDIELPQTGCLKDQAESNMIAHLAISRASLLPHPFLNSQLVGEHMIVRNHTSVHSVMPTMLFLARHRGGQTQSDRLLAAEAESSLIRHTRQIDRRLGGEIAVWNETQGLLRLFRTIGEATA